MLDNAAMALIIVLIVMAIKDWLKPTKAMVGIILLGAGALVGLAQGAAQIYLPPWANQAIAYGFAMAIFGGTSYGLIKANERAKLKQEPTLPTNQGNYVSVPTNNNTVGNPLDNSSAPNSPRPPNE
jgi:hypothetical protein